MGNAQAEAAEMASSRLRETVAVFAACQLAGRLNTRLKPFSFVVAENGQLVPPWVPFTYLLSVHSVLDCILSTHDSR